MMGGDHRRGVAGTAAALERRVGANRADAITDPNALGATRSSDPDVGADRLSGGEASPI